MWAILQVFWPLSYLLVKHDGMERFGSRVSIEILIPTIIGFIFSFFATYILKDFVLIGDNGAFSSIADLCQLLAAFFLAALAAVATFGNPELEKRLRGAPAYIYRWSKEMDRPKKVYLTRRAFLTRQFGYLSWVSIILFIAISAFEASSNIQIITNVDLLHISNFILAGLGMAVFINILFVTASAIIFFISRLNEEEAP